LWSDRPAQVSLVEEKGLAVVSTEVGVDEGYGYDLSLESYEAQDSQCEGAIKVPNDFDECALLNGCDNQVGIQAMGQSEENPPWFCSDTVGVLRGAFQDGVSTITGEAFGDVNILGKALSGVMKTLLNGGVVTGLMVIILDMALSLICNRLTSAPSPAYVEYADVVKISGSVFDQKMVGYIEDSFFVAYEDLYDRKMDGFDLAEIREMAQDFRVMARQLARSGYQANALFASAAKTSLLLLQIMHMSSGDDATCSCQAVRRANDYRTEFLALWNNQVYGSTNNPVEGSWQAYRANLLNPANIKYKKRNQWACSEFWKGSWYNQYDAKVVTPNNEVFESAWSRGGVDWSCHSNKSRKDEAKNKLIPEIEAELSLVESKTFDPEIKAFFRELTNKIPLEALGC
jgi:hypothetical protein